MGSAISNLLEGVHNGAQQLILQIDPSILKLKNTTFIVLDEFERKIHLNTEEYFISLRKNPSA
ncbi:unnamed protein product, partial [Adineta steineri]